MKVASSIAYIVNRLPRGYVFTYAEVSEEVSNKEAAIKALNRMVAAGKLEKISKGRFYKPEITRFGALQPEQEELIKDLLAENGKVIGYLTGFSMFNRLGLTTQFSFTIQIGKNEVRPAFKRDRYAISFIKQKNTITKENIPLLQILDAIRYIKKIPDTTVTTSCKRLLAIIKELSEKDKSTLAKLALKYPPATRALTGALLEEADAASLTESLRASLNPITIYKLPRAAQALPNAAQWNIR